LLAISAASGGRENPQSDQPAQPNRIWPPRRVPGPITNIPLEERRRTMRAVAMIHRLLK